MTAPRQNPELAAPVVRPRLRRTVALTWLAAAVAAVVALSPATGQSSPASAREDAVAILPDFVEIPAGPFIMGADSAHDPDAFSNERWSPSEGQGTVDLPAYLISRHEITVGQFAAFAQSGTWSIPPQPLDGPPTHPVQSVAWPEALAYCRWLQATLERSGVSGLVRQRLAEGWRVRLPSEAQWEKAARGTDGRRFPWGNEPLAGRANFGGTGTTPVGQYACPECPYGLADMSGNVWEWTISPHEPYPYDPGRAFANLDGDALFVIRGGHFGDPARLVRTTTRGAADPGARRAFIGFRVVLSPN